VLNQSTNDITYYHRLFEDGQQFPVNLFLDFEDWRIGTRGFSWDGIIPPTQEGMTSIPDARAKKLYTMRGSHFFPFDFPSLGPNIPCYRDERNQGLILDRQLQYAQILKQQALVDDLEGRIDWSVENIEWAVMGPVLRSRKDVKSTMEFVIQDYTDWYDNEVQELSELTSSMCVETQCTITFDTNTLQLTGAITGQGSLRKTDIGTEVACFAFNSIYLGPETEVILIGQRALSIISKTSMFINTTIQAQPGTIGGFQGGYSVARLTTEALNDFPKSIFICDLGGYCDGNRTLLGNGTLRVLTDDEVADIRTNNVNGPGSGNLRIHGVVITTSAPHIPEVQLVTTFAQAGQTLAGGFLLSYGDYTTPLIRHDASADELKAIIESNLNIVPPGVGVSPTRTDPSVVAGIGTVTVSRSDPDNQEGFQWLITFSSAMGNTQTLGITSYLQGLQAGITIETAVPGNEIGGTFELHFEGATTAPISFYESAAGLKAKLLELPMVATAFVERIDPTENCDDGLCLDGPLPCRGLIWTVYVGTNATWDNVSPTSPTSPLNNETGPEYTFSYTSSLTGTNASINLDLGFSTSPNGLVSKLNVSIPFSLAFGGAGGSYGGLGGAGYGENPVGALYNDREMTDLLGGSGGAMRASQLFEINSALGDSSGAGGHGGGAIELIAANDVEIGSYGKIIVDGGDAGQSSEGGGGGGSGGGILISVGGVIVNSGLLSSKGGSGGHGGDDSASYEKHVSKIGAGAGGGGGGGRIALFAQSFTNTYEGTTDVSGGACGIYKTAVNESVVEVNSSLLVQISLPLDDARMFHVGSTFVMEAMPFVQFIHNTNITRHELNGALFAYIGLTLVMDSEVDLDAVKAAFNEAAAYKKIGEITFLEAEWLSMEYTNIFPIRELPSSCVNHGEEGTSYSQVSMFSNFLVSKTDAAEKTGTALYLSNANEATKTVSGSPREAPFAWNGPVIPFAPSHPNRVTYYTRMDSIEGESKKANFGSLFTLLSRGVPGLNISNVIGVYVGDKMMQGHNFGSAVDEKFFLKRLVTINEYPAFGRWYKVDIHINWDKHTYSVSLDDQIAVQDVEFTAPDVDGIRLSINRAGSVWFDEIYVGFDNTMDFTCPKVTRKGTTTVGPVQRAWSPDEMAGDTGFGYTQYRRMKRHYAALEVEGSIPFDGQGQITFNSDIKLKFPTGDYPNIQGNLHAGSLVFLKNEVRAYKTPSGRSATLVNPNGLWYSAEDGPGGAGDGRLFWYTEYNHVSSISDTLNGGVAACSSQDLKDWRFEGIVFHYANLTDLVQGSEGPFYVERPKVLFNPNTGTYVMWAAMDSDTSNRSLAMNAVMSSPFIDGPFLLKRSFYPDGNKTRDQVVFVNDENRPALGRTYYQTIEFVLPEAMMQPTWESAKGLNGKINFASNYHRANYHKGYDQYHDIYNQRWRTEDKPWEVVCVNRLTGVERPVEAPTKENPGGCLDPEEFKEVKGQGDPAIPSKFISPNDTDNSWWLPTSVPDVQSQPWGSNYKDGYCGVRILDDGMDLKDPAIDDFESPHRGDCSNIADNPLHYKLQDKLIGVQRVIAERRAKFMAVSELTPDYMDTNGILKSFEGEFDGGHLIAMIIEMGQFGFSPGSSIGSTYAPPVMSEFETAVDYKTRFRQYIRNFNDRATYSLACVLDGVCPVDFASQLTEGHK